MKHPPDGFSAELQWKTAFLEAQINSSIDGIIVVDAQGRKILQNPRIADLFSIPPHIAADPDDSIQVRWVTGMVKEPAKFGEKVRHLYAHPDEVSRDEIELNDGRFLDRHSSPVSAQDGQSYGRIWTFRDITESKRSQAALLESTHFMQSALDALSAHIAILDEQGTIIKVNAAWDRFARDNGYEGEHLGVGDSYLAVCDSATGEFAEEGSVVADGIRAMMAGLTGEFQLEYPCHSPTEERWFVVRATRFKSEGEVRVVVAHENVTERKLLEAGQERSNRALLETSRLAGMAEVATGVLHNVGNVLNSVNVASTLLAERVRKSKISSLSKVADLLLLHEKDPAAFLTADPKGKQLPGYLAKLAAHLAGERDSALKELARLQDHIEHIKDIVAMQQNFARVSGITEALIAEDLVEDALKLNSSSLERHDIVVIRDYQEVPPVTVEKHKALQILVNLVSNAKQSCEQTCQQEKRITLAIRPAGDRIHFSVGDNGIGIPPENLTRIFAHGFTTKPGGHGFGLHGAALAATEMGGSLTVQSAGPGQGATFILELPQA